mmetsp:Transcript_5879/g.10287  ORF Transcript_5879/g.10287 Transcript_5879/m.10287 type:complete len:105 (-) Transcript_5879:45-359(-)
MRKMPLVSGVLSLQRTTRASVSLKIRPITHRTFFPVTTLLLLKKAKKRQQKLLKCNELVSALSLFVSLFPSPLLPPFFTKNLQIYNKEVSNCISPKYAANQYPV